MNAVRRRRPRVSSWPVSLFRRHPSAADLSARADGSLAGRSRARVDAHLARCATCRRRLQELAVVHDLLASLPPAPAPRSFRLSPAMVRQTEAAPARPFPILQLATAVAAVTFGLLLAGDLWTLGGEPKTTPTTVRTAATPKEVAPADRAPAGAMGAAPSTLAPAGELEAADTTPYDASQRQTPAPGATLPVQVEPAMSQRRLDKGRLALRAAEAVVGAVAVGGAGGLVLRRRRRAR